MLTVAVAGEYSLHPILTVFFGFDVLSGLPLVIVSAPVVAVQEPV